MTPVRRGPVVVIALIVCAVAFAGCGAASARTAQSGDATWQYQLQGPVDTSVDAGTFVVDGFDTSAAVVADLHSRGRTVICYVNAGAFEQWRPDAGSYPAGVIGNDLDGWAGERWVDIRRTDDLTRILGDRFDMCRAKGFDGVEADNVDGYTQDTGFPLSDDDQLRFNRTVAALAHDRGLTAGLKNDLDQIGELVTTFDFAVNESCAQFGECAELTPFVDAGKPVLHVEYGTALDAFCPESARLGLRSIRKPLDLTAEVEACPAAAGSAP